jgi:uncharacterized membrane protein YkgB
MKAETVARWIHVALGINFVWFGALKFLPGLSPAETLATTTIEALTFGLIAAPLSIKLLAIWEVTVGIGFLSGRLVPLFLRLFMVHMVLTFSPLFLFPEMCFSHVPYGLTLVGQYIVKNLVFISAGALVCVIHRERERQRGRAGLPGKGTAPSTLAA